MNKTTPNSGTNDLPENGRYWGEYDSDIEIHKFKRAK